MMAEAKEFPMEIPAEKANGVYSNQAVVRHSNLEFILDFAHRTPESQKPLLVSRVTMSPQHTKSFLAALQNNIGAYEKKFGEIKLPEGPSEWGVRF